jgi:hypothetical protein
VRKISLAERRKLMRIPEMSILGKKSDLFCRVFFLAVTLAAGAFLLFQVPRRGFDPDELEHIHAACAVS